MRWRTAAGTATGVGLLVSFLVWSDLPRVAECLRVLGWAAPLVLLPEALVLILDTRGWQCVMAPDARRRVPFASLYLTRMAGEAVNGITPAATVGGEPVKAHLLRRFGVAGSEAMASVIVARTALVVSQSIFVAAGATALIAHLGRPGLAALWLVPQAMLVAGFTLLLVRAQRRGLATATWRMLRRVAPRAHWVARLEQGAGALDQRLDDFHRLEAGTLARATGWHLAGWVFGTGEVLFLLWLIDAPVALSTAFLIESLGQVVRAAALVIPGALGVQEWGGAWLTTTLGVAEPQAVTLWLLKRARETVFDMVGLAYLGKRAAR